MQAQMVCTTNKNKVLALYSIVLAQKRGRKRVVNELLLHFFFPLLSPHSCEYERNWFLCTFLKIPDAVVNLKRFTQTSDDKSDLRKMLSLLIQEIP